MLYDVIRTTTEPGSAPSPVRLVTWKQASATYSDPTLDSHEQLTASAGKPGHKETALCQLEGEPVDDVHAEDDDLERPGGEQLLELCERLLRRLDCAALRVERGREGGGRVASRGGG